MRSYGYRSIYSFGPGWTPAIKYLIITNLAVFILHSFAGRSWTLLFGLVPNMVFREFMFWQLFTYLFLHGGFFHLLFNMFALWMFGSDLERQWGSREFLKYYFVTGIGAGIITYLTAMNSSTPTIGASGAVFGILLAFAMLFPNRLIYIYFLFPVKAKYFVMVIGGLALLASFRHTSDGIAHFAHLGGMVVGYIYMKFDWIVDTFLNYYSETKRQSVIRGQEKRNRDIRVIQEQVDAILDKISAKGMESLTDRERRILYEASEKGKQENENSNIVKGDFR